MILSYISILLGSNNLAIIGDFFKSKYSDPSLKQNFLKANQFHDFAEYFVKKVGTF